MIVPVGIGRYLTQNVRRRTLSTYMSMYVCTYFTAPETGARVWLMSVLAPLNCAVPMIILDSKQEVRNPGPLHRTIN